MAELRRFGPDRKWKIRLSPAGHAKSVTMMGMSVRSSSFMCVILLVLGGTLMYHVRGRSTLVIRNTCKEPCKETPSPGQSRSWKHPPTTLPAYKSTTSPRASLITYPASIALLLHLFYVSITKTHPSTYLLPCRDMSSTKTSTPVLPGSLVLHFMSQHRLIACLLCQNVGVTAV